MSCLLERSMCISFLSIAPVLSSCSSPLLSRVFSLLFLFYYFWMLINVQHLLLDRQQSCYSRDASLEKDRGRSVRHQVITFYFSFFSLIFRNLFPLIWQPSTSYVASHGRSRRKEQLQTYNSMEKGDVQQREKTVNRDKGFFKKKTRRGVDACGEREQR